jgi:hypothetical protein
VPVVLSRAAGNPEFGQDWSASISRAGDYLLQTWLRLQVSDVTPLSAWVYDNGTGANQRVIRWTKNFMHNLIKECAITFNDLVAARFDNYHLDFWAAFTVPAGKQNGYQNMIGNVPGMIFPAPNSVSGSLGLTSQILNLPLPLFYGRDSGVALPTAALPYNEMRINLNFRDWSELLIQQTADDQSIGTPVTSGDVGTILSKAPSLSYVNVWANYAIVSNDERKRMACAPRDILIEQVQTAPRQTFDPANNTTPSYDIRFSHAIKVLFFSVKNKTDSNEWSNYTTVSPVVKYTPNGPCVDFYNQHTAADPIETTSLVYENTARLSVMGSDYFSLVNPYFHAPVIPVQIGYHTYSYSLDFICLDPMGSTNYGKLTNVSIGPNASVAAKTAAGPGSISSQTGQKYEFIVTAVNNNIIRISGGKLPSVPQTVDCYKRCDNSFMGKQCKLSPLIQCI